MVKKIVAHVREGIKKSSKIGYHIIVLCLSAGIAMSLPIVATIFLDYWTKVEKEKVSLVTLEIGVAVFLIIVMTYIRRSWKDRKLAKMAIDAGFVSFFPHRARRAEDGIRKLRETRGAAGRSWSSDQVGMTRCVIRWGTYQPYWINAWEPTSCW